MSRWYRRSGSVSPATPESDDKLPATFQQTVSQSLTVPQLKGMLIAQGICNSVGDELKAKLMARLQMAYLGWRNPLHEDAMATFYNNQRSSSLQEQCRNRGIEPGKTTIAQMCRTLVLFEMGRLGETPALQAHEQIDDNTIDIVDELRAMSLPTEEAAAPLSRQSCITHARNRSSATAHLTKATDPSGVRFAEPIVNNSDPRQTAIDAIEKSIGVMIADLQQLSLRFNALKNMM